MAVTESDLDPKVRKMSITFYWLWDLWAEHAGVYISNWYVVDSKKTISDLIIQQIIYHRPKKCPTILYAINLWLKPVSSTGARVPQCHNMNVWAMGGVPTKHNMNV